MLPLPITLNDPQLMKEYFAFELIDENRHREFLESCFTKESDVKKALRSWAFYGVTSPSSYKFTRVIKRVSNGEYLCYADGMLMNITDTTYRLINGGRIMPENLRNRGELTKAIADEGIDYFFQRFPLTVDEIQVQLPGGFDMSKRATKAPESTITYGTEASSYSQVVWTRQAYLDSL